MIGGIRTYPDQATVQADRAEQKADAIDIRLKAMETAVAAMQAQVQALQDKDNLHDTQIDDLEARVSALEV